MQFPSVNEKNKIYNCIFIFYEFRFVNTKMDPKRFDLYCNGIASYCRRSNMNKMLLGFEKDI